MVEWFEGDIGSAIQRAKAECKLFVVVLTAASEDEAGVLSLCQSEPVAEAWADACVVIRLHSGSTLAQQFGQLYPIESVPAVYYIHSLTGRDLAQATGPELTVEAILRTFERARQLFGTPTSLAPAVASPRGQRVEAASSALQSSLGSERVSPADSLPAAPLATRLARAQALLAESRSDAKDSDPAQPHPAAETAAQARERVQGQIEADRTERARQFADHQRARRQSEQARQAELGRQAAEQAEAEAAVRAQIARVQFRLPDGRARVHQFPSDGHLGLLYAFVAAEVEKPFTRFSLSTTFPTRQLDTLDRSVGLTECGVVPSGTVLVLPPSTTHLAQHATGGLASVLGLIRAPLNFLWTWVASFWTPSSSPATRRPAATGSESAARSPRGTVRHRGNVTGLADLGDTEDKDDENNTWNGNSTQQM